MNVIHRKHKLSSNVTCDFSSVKTHKGNILITIMEMYRDFLIWLNMSSQNKNLLSDTFSHTYIHQIHFSMESVISLFHFFVFLSNFFLSVRVMHVQKICSETSCTKFNITKYSSNIDMNCKKDAFFLPQLCRYFSLTACYF